MKRIHEYNTETLETYYALGKGNKFLKEIDTGAFISIGEVIMCKEPKDAYTFRNFERAKRFLIEYSDHLEGFKIYSIHHKVKTETMYSVLDCEKYKTEQNGPMIINYPTPKGIGFVNHHCWCLQ